MLFLTFFEVYQVAHADMGPKLTLTIYVGNFDNQEYYLDLLVKRENSNILDEFSNMSDEPISNITRTVIVQVLCVIH